MASEPYDIQVYGTGLALGLTHLEDGARVVIRREPEAEKWTARMQVGRLFNIPKALEFTDTAYEGGDFVVYGVDPEQAVNRLQMIIKELEDMRLEHRKRQPSE